MHQNKKVENLADFLPIAAHFDTETLITKSGDLIQTIRVDGFEPNDANFRKKELRTLVREVINKHLCSEEYFIYINVVRERSDRSIGGKFPLGFTAELDESWTYANNWHKQLANSLFITVVQKRYSAPFINPKYLWKKHFKQMIYNDLYQSTQVLTAKTDDIISDLKRFGASRLSTYILNGLHYSQQLSFFNYLFNLCEEEVLLPEVDFSEYLTQHTKRSYLFNSIEIQYKKQHRYSAIFVPKDVYDIPSEVYDLLLQIGSQFIITEAFRYVEDQEAEKFYNEQLGKMHSLSDEKILQQNSLNKIPAFNNSDDEEDQKSKSKSDGNNKNSKDFKYCQLFTMINIFSDDQKFFDQKIEMLLDACHSLGIALIREDFNSASVSISQIPGNMRYLKRGRYVPKEMIANFSSIHQQQMGNYIGSKWGKPITVFRALDGNPYYFNFHDNQNGNTLIIGNKGGGRTTLCRFMLAQARKLDAKILYLDFDGGSELYTETIGGMYKKVDTNQGCPLKVDMFNFDYYNNDQESFKQWLKDLLLTNPEHKEFYDELFALIAKKLMEADKNNISINDLKALVEGSEDDLLISAFRSTLAEDIFSNLYSTDDLSILDKESFVTLDFSALVAKPQLCHSFVFLLLQMITKYQKGGPLILMIDGCKPLLDNALLVNSFDKILKEFTNSNKLLLLSESYSNKKIDKLGQYAKNFGHQIFCSYKYLDRSFISDFEISEEEFIAIKSFEPRRRYFLMKNSKECIVGNIDLSKLESQLEVIKGS